MIGRNDCANPQAVCPRAPGEGYEKCRTICGQPGHAEIMALVAARASGLDTTVARGRLYGQDDLCEDCAAALYRAGVQFVTIYGKGSIAPPLPKPQPAKES